MVRLVFGFASHWLKNWRESFKPIIKRSNCNHVITFYSHLKTALISRETLCLLGKWLVLCSFHRGRGMGWGNEEWLDLYYRRIIRLGRAWAKNGSSSDNPSVYKHGQAEGSSTLTSYRNSPSFQTNYRG